MSAQPSRILVPVLLIKLDADHQAVDTRTVTVECDQLDRTGQRATAAMEQARPLGDGTWIAVDVTDPDLCPRFTVETQQNVTRDWGTE